MNDIQIRTVQLCDDERVVALASAFLHHDEQQRAEQFQFPRDRAAFVVARAVLRILCGQLVGAAPEQLRFRYGPHGKPALDPPYEWLCFIVAHSGGHAAYVFAFGLEVGIDIERHRNLDDLQQITRRFFHPDECAEIMVLNDDDRPFAFFDCWARKEAYLKATGLGLSLPLDGFRVPVRAPGNLQPWPHDQRNWILHDICCVSGYSAAVIYEAAPNSRPAETQMLLSESMIRSASTTRTPQVHRAVPDRDFLAATWLTGLPR